MIIWMTKPDQKYLTLLSVDTKLKRGEYRLAFKLENYSKYIKRFYYYVFIELDVSIISVE